MKISCIQMDMALGRPEQNFEAAARLVREAAGESPDVIVLPETWNTGFFPRENLAALCDQDCAQLRQTFGALARELCVNLVAGSVSNVREGRVYNTACVFDRTGTCIAQYDKTHLFTPMDEHAFYTPGSRLCRFQINGVECGLIICYDIRFPELTRTLALSGAQMLFVVSQWPKARAGHLQTLLRARAIENQMFAVCCNSCGTAGETRYAGASAIVDPWGETLAQAGQDAQIISATCDLTVVADIRQTINVFHDRRPELYHVES